MKPGQLPKPRPPKVESPAWAELEAILVEGIREWLETQGEKAS